MFVSLSVISGTEVHEKGSVVSFDQSSEGSSRLPTTPLAPYPASEITDAATPSTASEGVVEDGKQNPSTDEPPPEPPGWGTAGTPQRRRSPSELTEFGSPAPPSERVLKYQYPKVTYWTPRETRTVMRNGNVVLTMLAPDGTCTHSIQVLVEIEEISTYVSAETYLNPFVNKAFENAHARY